MPYFGIPIRNGLPIGLGSVAGFGAFQFSPSVLFTAGEQGAWYDPSDLTTLFQDAAGTTPTTMETRARLMLDKSKGLVLGSELFVNPNCTDLTGFTTGGTNPPTLTFDNGVKGTVTIDDAAGRIQTTTITGLVVGKTYLVTVTANNACTKGNFVASAWTWGTIADTNFALGVSTRTFRVTATATSGVCRYYLGNQADNDGNVATITQHSIKELAGNHAVAPSDASSPILRARYNLLTYSEDFSNAAWTKNSAGIGTIPVVTANAGLAPNGTLTADRIQFDCGSAASAANRSLLAQNVTVISGQAHTGQIWLKAYDSGNVGKTVRVVIESNSNEVIHTLTADWSLVSLPGTATNTTINFLFETRGLFTQQTADVLVWGSGIRLTADAALNIPAYQSITTATSYDTNGFPPYLAFDGTDDSFSTAAVDFTGTDSITVVSGLTKLSDAAGAFLVELTSNVGTQPGSFAITAPNSASATIAVASNGTSVAAATASGYASPVSLVATELATIATDSLTLRLNGAAAATSSSDQGTGNYANAPIFIGRRNNTSAPFNGRIYSLIIRGAATTTPLIASTESWVAGKMRLPI